MVSVVPPLTDFNISHYDLKYCDLCDISMRVTHLNDTQRSVLLFILNNV